MLASGTVSFHPRQTGTISWFGVIRTLACSVPSVASLVTPTMLTPIDKEKTIIIKPNLVLVIEQHFVLSAPTEGTGTLPCYQ